MNIVASERAPDAAKVEHRHKAAWKAPGTVETIALRALALVVILGVWEGVVRMELLSDFFISRPVSVGRQLAEWLFIKGTIWPHAAVTLQEVLLGLAGGASFGVVSGFALGMWPRLNVALDPYIMGLYGMPRAALAPLFIMWFGIGMESKAILAGFVTYFVLLTNTCAGVKSVDADLVDAVKTMGGRGTFLLRKVVLPSCAPWILSGLRLGLTFSLTGAVFAEMIAAERGMGWIIARASGLFDTTSVFAGIFVLAVVAMVLNEGMKKLERHLLRWRGEVIL